MGHADENREALKAIFAIAYNGMLSTDEQETDLHCAQRRGGALDRITDIILALEDPYLED